MRTCSILQLSYIRLVDAGNNISIIWSISIGRNHIGGVMICVRGSSAVDRGFETGPVKRINPAL
jgi:hypothetical protein